MKKYFYQGFVFVFLNLISFFAHGQSEEIKSSLRIIAKSTDTGIILRWAPDRPLAWYLSLQAGYKIERMELPNAKASIADGIFTELAPVLKPWPLDEWQAISPPMTQDQNAVVAAQMIYGKSWKYQNDKNASFIAKADELKNRFSYNLLAADLSAAAASASALRWVDKNVKRGYVYIYKVTSLAKSTLFETTPGTIVVHEKNRIKVTNPEIDHAAQGDRVVYLRWDKVKHQDNFTAYFIERSDDGKTYNRLNKTPYLSDDFKQDSLSTEYFVYQDSTERNYKKYYYRIIGITPFAEYSAPSSAVIQYSIDKTPPPAPIQVRATQIGPNKIKIEWNHAGASDLKGFFVGHSFDPTSEYSILHLDPVSPNTHFYIHDSVNTLRANHYIIAAVDTTGNASYSLNTYGHLIDSIPPGIPMGLKGKIDTNGLVHLTWNVNKDPDIMGYVIHFSNDSNHVFAVVTNKPVLVNAYVDTIMLKTLTERIYYKIAAIDRYFNYSDFSAVLALQKPDLIPPSAPIFTDHRQDTGTITLYWNASTSHDVVRHLLYRKTADADWKLIKSFPSPTTVRSYQDKAVEPSKEYEYKIVAQDDAGLLSISAFTFKAKLKEKINQADVNDFVIVKEGTKAFLSWTSSAPLQTQYIIYKAVDQGPYTAIDKCVTKSYVDLINPEQKHISYVIRVRYPDGKMSDYSQAKQL
ncbi:MAG: hypothetical protein ABI761_14615 [Saprospiraceae bacterium]